MGERKAWEPTPVVLFTAIGAMLSLAACGGPPGGEAEPGREGGASPAQVDVKAVESARKEEERVAAQVKAAVGGIAPTQFEFCKAVIAGAKAYEAGKNDLQRSKARGDRAKAMKAVQPGPELWRGVVRELTTSPGGKAILVVEPLGCQDFAVRTAALELSDALRNVETLIPQDSPQFATLSAMAVGDQISFLAEFIPDAERVDAFDEVSVTERGSMTGGGFVARFLEVYPMQGALAVMKGEGDVVIAAINTRVGDDLAVMVIGASEKGIGVGIMSPDVVAGPVTMTSGGVTATSDWSAEKKGGGTVLTPPDRPVTGDLLAVLSTGWPIEVSAQGKNGAVAMTVPTNGLREFIAEHQAK